MFFAPPVVVNAEMKSISNKKNNPNSIKTNLIVEFRLVFFISWDVISS